MTNTARKYREGSGKEGNRMSIDASIKMPEGTTDLSVEWKTYHKGMSLKAVDSPRAQQLQGSNKDSVVKGCPRRV